LFQRLCFFSLFSGPFFHVSLAPSIELGCVWPPKGLEDLVISPFGAPLLNTVILLSSGVTVTCAHYAFLAYCYKQRRLANFLNVFGEYSVLRSINFFYTLSVLGGKEWWWLKSEAVVVVKVLSLYLVRTFRRIKYRMYYKILYRTLLDASFVNCFNYFVFTLILAVFFTVSQGLEYVESAVTISDGVYGSTFFVMTGFHGFHVIVGTIFLFVCFLRILFHRYSFVHFIGLECAIWYWHFVDVVWLFLFLFVYYWGNALVPVIDYSVFGTAIHADFASKFQFDFQDSASVLMESIVDLHNYIMFYLWVILGMVTWMLFVFSAVNPTSYVRAIVILIKLMVLDIKTREFISRRLFYISRHEFSKTHYLLSKMRDRKLGAPWSGLFQRISVEIRKRSSK